MPGDRPPSSRAASTEWHRRRGCQPSGTAGKGGSVANGSSHDVSTGTVDVEAVVGANVISGDGRPEPAMTADVSDSRVDISDDSDERFVADPQPAQHASSTSGAARRFTSR